MATDTDPLAVLTEYRAACVQATMLTCGGSPLGLPLAIQKMEQVAALESQLATLLRRGRAAGELIEAAKEMVAKWEDELAWEGEGWDGEGVRGVDKAVDALAAAIARAEGEGTNGEA